MSENDEYKRIRDHFYNLYLSYFQSEERANNVRDARLRNTLTPEEKLTVFTI